MIGPIGFFAGFLIFGTGVILDRISKSRRLSRIEKWIERHDYQQNISDLVGGQQAAGERAKKASSYE